MLGVYHKISLVERSPRRLLNALATRLRHLILRLWRLVCHRLEEKTIPKSRKIFLSSATFLL
jgi:hypothetical protein